jgi:folate-binding protein YgfZ
VIAERPSVDLLEAAGEDRLRFVNGLVTCDVKSLAPGDGRYGFFTGAQGKLLADVVVLALADRLWLELPAGKGGEIAAHLRRYQVADRVEVRPLGDRCALLLAGPRAVEALGADAVPSAAPWSHSAATLGGLEVLVVRQGRVGVDAFSVWVAAAEAPALRESLSSLSEFGLVPVTPRALDVVRVEAGHGRFAQDFGADHFPQETGAEAEAVSYEKGCYLGQEIVARIHHRGGVQHALRGLLCEGEELPRVGTPLFLEEREVGKVTSAVLSPRLRRPLGLAVLHRRGWDPGARLQLAGGGGEVEVAALPFTA